MNKAISSIIFHVPDMVIDQFGMHLETTNVICYNAKVSDISLVTTLDSSSLATSVFNLQGLAFDCSGDFSYKTLIIFTGSGTILAEADKGFYIYFGIINILTQ